MAVSGISFRVFLLKIKEKITFCLQNAVLCGIITFEHQC